jgi:AcrR family transcriptional regulator
MTRSGNPKPCACRELCTDADQRFRKPPDARGRSPIRGDRSTRSRRFASTCLSPWAAAHVRAAILDTTWALAAEHDALSISMSQGAEAVGIGRATLYKYFPSIEAILHAWHQRQIADHVHQPVELRALPSSPADQLE